MMTMTPQQASRAVRLALLTVVLGAGGLGVGGLGAGVLHAQDLPEPGDGFTWERVGDRGIDVQGLAFGSDSTLWAAGSRGPYRLDTTDGFPGRWIFLSDFPAVGSLLVLGRGPEGDTLVTGRSVTRRSVDGGVTWEVVHDRGGGGLYEIPAGLPHAGRILTGGTAPAYASSIGFSDDRGATFAEAVVPSPDGNTASAEDFVALPPGSPHAGRILAVGRWGVNISDDGGETFRESGLWQAVYYVGEAVDGVEQLDPVAGTGGEVGAVVAGRVSGQANARVWSSADSGEAWGPGDGLHLVESPPSGSGSAKAVLSLGGASVVVVLKYGTVYRTNDAGQTWEPVGRAPEISASPSVFVTSAVLGPDRRLYVGLADTSAEEGWVWRTKETHDPSPPVPSEPEPPSEEPLGLEVRPNPARGTSTVALTLLQPAEVEAALYDVLGRRVAVLHDGLLGAGRHELPLDDASLPPGVYVVRLAAGGAVASRTFTLLR